MIGDKIALWLLRAITALIIAFTALVFSGSACAGTLGLHIGSQHFPARDFNNFNPAPTTSIAAAPLSVRTTTASAANRCTLGGHGTTGRGVCRPV